MSESSTWTLKSPRIMAGYSVEMGKSVNIETKVLIEKEGKGV